MVSTKRTALSVSLFSASLVLADIAGHYHRWWIWDGISRQFSLTFPARFRLDYVRERGEDKEPIQIHLNQTSIASVLKHYTFICIRNYYVLPLYLIVCLHKTMVSSVYIPLHDHLLSFWSTPEVKFDPWTTQIELFYDAQTYVCILACWGLCIIYDYFAHSNPQSSTCSCVYEHRLSHSKDRQWDNTNKHKPSRNSTGTSPWAAGHQ